MWQLSFAAYTTRPCGRVLILNKRSDAEHFDSQAELPVVPSAAYMFRDRGGERRLRPRGRGSPHFRQLPFRANCRSLQPGQSQSPGHLAGLEPLLFSSFSAALNLMIMSSSSAPCAKAHEAPRMHLSSSKNVHMYCLFCQNGNGCLSLGLCDKGHSSPFWHRPPSKNLHGTRERFSPRGTCTCGTGGAFASSTARRRGI